jgi:predicted TPR repeat methyltransferase
MQFPNASPCLPEPTLKPKSSDDYRATLYQRYVSSHLGPAAITTVAAFKPREPYLRSLIRKHFPAERTARILDLGCGHGTLIYFAQQAGYKNIRGVDASQEQVAAACQLGIDGISHGDSFTTLRSLPNSSHELIVAFDMIEHLTKPELLALADEVARVLVPEGRFLIHTPNAASPMFGAVRYGDYTHEQAFTASSLAQLMRACGFRRIECFEDVPIAHGIKSAVRLVAWKALRIAFAIAQVIETGNTENAIYSRNLVALATK